MGGAWLAVAAACAAACAAAFMLWDRSRSNGQARAAADARPILFNVLDGGDPGAIDSLEPAQRRIVEAQARSLLPKVKGRDKDVLARLLEKGGAVESARRQSHSRRATSRAKAGDFLGEAGSPAAVGDLLDLVGLLDDPDQKVRCSAALNLGRLGNVGAIAALRASLEGVRPIPVDVVAEAIFQIRDYPEGLLRRGLLSPTESERALSVELLGRFQHLVAADEVIELLLNDPSVDVRARAARSLGRMGVPGAVQPLLSCLGDGPSAVQSEVIWALGEIGGSEAIAALRAILLGPSRTMGQRAASALVATGPPGIESLNRIAGERGHPAAPIAAAALVGEPAP